MFTPQLQDTSFTLDDLDFSLGLQTTGNKRASTTSTAGSSASSEGPQIPALAPMGSDPVAKASPLALEDATAKDKLWMKVDQAVAATQTHLLAAKKTKAALANLQGTKSKTVANAEQMLEECVGASETILLQLTCLSINRTLTEGGQEPDSGSLTAFLKRAQETLNSLTEALTVAKALNKGRK